jgi:hypothetical protein
VLLDLDLLEHAYEYQPYTALKEQLLSSHELTNFERIKRLMKLEPLVGSKPTELLAETMEPNRTGSSYSSSYSACPGS